MEINNYCKECISLIDYDLTYCICAKYHERLHRGTLTGNYIKCNPCVNKKNHEGKINSDNINVKKSKSQKKYQAEIIFDSSEGFEQRSMRLLILQCQMLTNIANELVELNNK